MSLQVHWFLPTSGDSRNVVGAGLRSYDGDAPPGPFRTPDIDYLAQVARAAEQLGFTAVLTPTGTWCEDAWLVTAALTQHTERLKFLVAFRPGLLSPTLAAQMASSFQRLSGGRLLLNVVTGGDKTEQERFGDFLEKADRYHRTGEFLSVVRGAWGDEGFDLDGEHIQVRGAKVPDAPQPPGIYFGGSSPEALEVAAEHADVYLTWGEPPEQVAEKLGRVRELADARGRTLRYGIRLHVIARDTAEEAWAEAARLLDAMDPDAVRRAQENLRASESEGQRRMLDLHGGRRDSLVVAPNLWAGIGLVRGGAGTALVGSHEEIADRIAEYHEAGIDEFIFSGYPHLEELFWFGEGVVPILRELGLFDGGRVDTVPASIPFIGAAR
jgi:alkanesulfonate monooxygenase